jgi:hypothetical protein
VVGVSFGLGPKRRKLKFVFYRIIKHFCTILYPFVLKVP